MVVIKDMEMPKNCVECKLFHFYFDLNSVMHYICKYRNMEMCGDLKNKRNDFCPLIEVDKERRGINMIDKEKISELKNLVDVLCDNVSDQPGGCEACWLWENGNCGKEALYEKMETESEE